MSEFEPRENEEDAVDLMCSLIREIAESGSGIHLAQMVQNAKDLWQKGEVAAAYWMLEAFKMGQENAMGSAIKLDRNGKIRSDLEKHVFSEDGLWYKLGSITRKMEDKMHGLHDGLSPE